MKLETSAQEQLTQLLALGGASDGGASTPSQYTSALLASCSKQRAIVAGNERFAAGAPIAGKIDAQMSGPNVSY